MSSAPPRPASGSLGRRTTAGSSSSSSSRASRAPLPPMPGGGPGAIHRSLSLGSSSSLPPPPNVTPTKGHSLPATPLQGGQTSYAQSLARSMTIDEMRALHRRALSEAEAKQTELRLVLASRYRELVGSSDEVTKMRERAQELHELVAALPTLMERLLQSSVAASRGGAEDAGADTDEESKAEASSDVEALRRQLATWPRLVHRALDKNDVHEATVSLMQLFRLIAEQTDEYPLATALAPAASATVSNKSVDTLLQAQMRMTFLHVQTIPTKIIKIAKRILNSAASFGADVDPKYGAQTSAAALSSLDLLEIHGPATGHRDRPIELLDLYFDSKANLLQSLLSQLNTTSPQQGGTTTSNREDGEANNDSDTASASAASTNNAEEILSKIVLILQYDIVLHPYEIFVLRKFPTMSSSSPSNSGGVDIMKSLPMFPAKIVQAKASNFLSAHLPLIRTKVKSVLVDIAGTTASALGKIRQSLYDKTDGVECMERLDHSTEGICTWEEAVDGVVDVESVLISSGGATAASSALAYDSSGTAAEGAGVASAYSSSRHRKFSLWGVLFSNTFSSLVHSLLTSSFQSVHTKVVSTLRLSLANAPPLSSILPHEAYRNTLHIATELDTALLKVSDDAHELLVHAEERVESERRLRQSLYVQTCEIMGRLICELRRMLLISDNFDAVKELIVGRLCHLLKFRLTALPTLLDPNSSPAVLLGTTGMVSLIELSSAFDLADDNDDGLITFQEAMEAVDSAFSGTQFHGAEMVRETLLLPASGEKDRSLQVSIDKSVTPQDVTLNELTLLLARGLRHEKSGGHSALGTIQNSLDSMMTSCFVKWAKDALLPYSSSLSTHLKSFVEVACTSPEEEYKRMFASSESSASTMNPARTAPAVSNVSPHITSFLLDLSFTLNRSLCPSDSLLPVPSMEYAFAMGVEGSDIPRMMDIIRWALLGQGLESVMGVLEEHVSPALQGSDGPAMKDSGPSGVAQLKNDLSFLQTCFFDRNRHGFGGRGSEDPAKARLERMIKTADILVRKVCDMNTIRQIEGKHEYVLEVCDLFISSLFGEDTSSAVPLGDLVGSLGATPRSDATPLFNAPLASSCRFPLLPIQADRTLSGVQARGKYKDKEESDSRAETVGTGAVRAGFGFFSSMLKKS